LFVIHVINLLFKYVTSSELSSFVPCLVHYVLNDDTLPYVYGTKEKKTYLTMTNKPVMSAGIAHF